jgi:hypothetical protein
MAFKVCGHPKKIPCSKMLETLVEKPHSFMIVFYQK